MPATMLFREGDPFEAIAAVRAGTVKTYVIDRDGHEHVLGLPPAGRSDRAQCDRRRDAIPCNAVALDTVMLCRFSFPKISVLAARLPGLQRQLFRLLSRDIGRAALLAGDWTADQRMAAFLVGHVAAARRARVLGQPLPADHGAHRHRQLPAAGAGNGQPGAAAHSRTMACWRWTGVNWNCSTRLRSRPWPLPILRD